VLWAKIKGILKRVVFNAMRYSLYLACKEQSLLSLRRTLDQAVPDLSDQYTTFTINSKYVPDKVRSLYAFQISLVLDVLSLLNNNTVKYIVDIGDSSGTHLQYLHSMFGDSHVRSLSVNLDPVAVKED